MKKIVRVFALVLVLCLCFSLLGACNKDKKTDSNTSSTIDVESVVTHNAFKFFEDGKANFRIVKDKDSKIAVGTAASIISAAFKTKFGVDISSINDDVPEGEVKEILIGDTNREESATVKALFESKRSGRITEYIVCTVNDKIVVYADHNDSIVDAAEYLVNTYINNNEVKDGIYQLYNESSGYKDLSILGNSNISKFKIVRPIYNVSYITQLEMEKLSKTLLEQYGYNVEIINDQVASTDKGANSGLGTLTRTEVGEYEIIVGNCNRDNVNIITNLDTYEIRFDGKKVYLNGGTAYSTAMAVSEFMTLLGKKNELTTADTVASGSYKAVIDNYDSATYYRYTWGDDFNGTEINTDIWDPCWDVAAYGGEGITNTFRGSSTLKNQYVKDGVLHMDGIKHEGKYYGGLITTQMRMEYKFGYLELSRMQPKHEGFWNALYTKNAAFGSDKETVTYEFEDPNDRFWYVNEIDVEECFGGGDWCYGNAGIAYNDYAKALLNTDDEGSIIRNNYLKSKDDRGFWMDFHTFGYVLNDTKSVSFTCDGNVWNVTQFDDERLSYAYDVSVFLRLGLAVNTSHHPVKDVNDVKTFTEHNSFKTDYVHLYQLKGQQLWLRTPSSGKWTKSVVK